MDASIRSIGGRRTPALLLCLATLLGAGRTLNAATLTFTVGTTNGRTNSEVVVPIRTRGFTSISAFQFSFHWNTNIASFVGVEQMGITGLTSNDFGIFASTGTLTVVWFDQDGTNKTLADDTMVFGVRLRLIGPAAATSAVTIDSVPTAVVAGDANGAALPVTITNGSLNIDHSLIVMCASNKTVECGTSWSFDPPSVLDSCGGLAVATNILGTITNANGTCGFTASRTWEVIDGCSNRTTCVQVVTAVDTTPPLPSCVPNKTVEFGQIWDFDVPTATDSCSGAFVTIRVLGTSTNAGACANTLSATRVWEFADGCSNKVTCAQVVTVSDTTAPAITCANTKTVNCLSAWTFDNPTAIDIASGTIVFPVVVSTTTNGACGSGFTAVRTWRATDLCGNSATCSQTVSGRAIVSISGKVYTPTNYPPTLSDKRIAGTTLIGPTNTSTTTADDGSYGLIFDAASNVAVRPMPPSIGAPADGVDSFDVILARKHILNAAPLDSPYKLLAADVDGDGTITALDLLPIRRVVLGITNRFPSGLWRFVPSNFAFPNVLSPWAAPTNRTYPSVVADLTGQDFVAIKFGDVNNSWTPPLSFGGSESAQKASAPEAPMKSAKAAGEVTFIVASTNGAPGTDILVPIRVQSFSNVASFQFSFHWNPAIARFIGVEQFGLPGLTSGPNNFNLGMSNAGTFTVLWDDPNLNGVDRADGDAIFYVRFNATGSPSNSTSLVIDGTPTGFLVTDSTPAALPSAAVAGQLTIDQPNRAPVLGNIGNKVVDEETLLTFTATVTDADGPGQTETFSLDPGAPAGASIGASSGVFTWTPTEAQGPATYPVTLRVTDNGSPPLSYSTTILITVNEINVPPTANADAYSVNEDTTLAASAPGVLGNDNDADGNPLSALLVAGVTHGTLNFSNNGSFTYTPGLNYTGADSFTYRASDGNVSSGVATVTIIVNPVNDAPVTSNEAYATSEDTALTISAPGVLANDFDTDGDVISAVLVTNPAHGVLNLGANGAFTYTPSLNYTGADSFTYRATDGLLTSSVATVTLTITPVNDAPVAQDDNYATDEDVAMVIATPGVLANDSDADGNTIWTLLISSPTHGTLNLNPNGAFTYTPSLNYTGSDTFTYAATDGSITSAVATVTITVQPVNDAPVASNDNYFIDEDTALSVGTGGVLANDIDLDGNALSAVLVSNPTHGVLNLSATGAFTYTPSLNYTGADSFTYRATDGLLTSSVATVTLMITPVNDAPIAVDDAYATAEDTTLTVELGSVLANDFDADGNGLTGLLVADVTHGTLSFSNNGTFVYRPSLNYTGEDTFSYRATDGVLTSAVATVTITITPVNDAPFAANDIYTTLEDTALLIQTPGVLANDSDVDGSVLSAVLVINPAHGTLSLSTNGAFVYTPSLNYTGADAFMYRATDGNLTSALATVAITIAPANDVSAVGNDAYTTLEDMSLTVASPGVLANDFDVDGDSLVAVLASNPTHGTLSFNGDGAFVYTPSLNYTGVDSFTYRATDGGLTSALATVTITIGPVNDSPIAQDDNFATDEDVPLIITAPGVLGNDNDLDDNGLTTVLVVLPTHGSVSLNSNGSFTYTPARDFNGTDSFSYLVSDGATNSNIATVTVQVRAANDPPVLASIGNKNATKGSLVTFTASATDVDIPAQTLTFSLDPGAPVDASIDPATGVFRWTPVDVQGPVSVLVTVRVTDDGIPARSDSETIAIMVDEVIHVSIGDVTLPGGSSGTLDGLFDVTLSSPSSQPVFVAFATADETAVSGIDYMPVSGTLMFPPGTTNHIIEVTVIGNNSVHTNRTFLVNLSNPTNAIIAQSQGLATITSEPAAGLSISDASVIEGSGILVNASFDVTLYPASDRLITVKYATARGSALMRKDFKPKRGTLKFPPGVTNQTILIPVVGDRLSEDSETFFVTLGTSVNGVVARGLGVGQIIDDDPLPTITVDDVAKVEGDTGTRALKFSVRLSAKCGRPISVDFATGEFTALAGSDYTATNGTLLFLPGVLTQKIAVPIIGNTVHEEDEIFLLNLGNPVNANIADGQGTGGIEDNDPSAIKLTQTAPGAGSAKSIRSYRFRLRP